MYKKIVTLLSVVAILSSCKKSDDGGSTNTAGASGPQITATAFISNHSAGSKLAGYYLDSGSIKFPVSGTNLSFKYDTVTIKGNWGDTLKSPLNTVDFAGATYMRGINQQILNQSVALNQYFQVTSSNWVLMGSYLDLPLNISIPSVGSIALPAQASKQVASLILASFPINYNDSVNQTSTNAITATASASGITGPITISQETKLNSKNIAWGSLKLKGYADSMQVVIQKYTTVTSTNITSTNPLLSLAIPSIISNYGLDKPVTTTLYRYWAKDKGLVMTLNADGTANITTGL
jgi:hypothetical protein